MKKKAQEMIGFVPVYCRKENNPASEKNSNSRFDNYDHLPDRYFEEFYSSFEFKIGEIFKFDDRFNKKPFRIFLNKHDAILHGFYGNYKQCVLRVKFKQEFKITQISHDVYGDRHVEDYTYFWKETLANSIFVLGVCNI